MILLQVMIYTEKNFFFEAPPEIYCHLLNFQYFAMRIEENIVEMLHNAHINKHVAVIWQLQCSNLI